MKKIFSILKKVVLSAFLLYGYNLIAAPMGIIIPINVFTIMILSFFGIPSIFSLIAIIILLY